MRPNSIRKTPHIAKKTPIYGDQPRQRLVLNEENDNRQPIIPPKGPRFNISKNKRNQQEKQKTKNIYAQISDIGKVPLEESKETKEPLQLKHKFKFTSRNQNKQSIVIDNDSNKKQEVIIGELKREMENEKMPEKPMFQSEIVEKSTLKLKPSLGRLNKLKKKIQEPQDNANDYIPVQKSEVFEISNAYDKYDNSFQLQEPQYNNNSYANIQYQVPVQQYEKYNINIDQLEDREISLAVEERPVNWEKQQKQLERVDKLRKIINLDMDMYEPMINLQSVTEYQLYISKIKSNTINNSQDQAFDDKVDKECQHSPSEVYDFGCQAPDDKKATYIRGLQSTGNFSLSLHSFVSKAATVIEELLRPNKSFSMPPIYLLSMNPQLIGLYNCPMPISLYKCGDLSLALFGQKLYVARGEITSLLSIGSLLLGGTNEGTILIWTGQTDKSTFYQSVKVTLGNSDFQLPSCSSDYLERQSYFKGSSRIVCLREKINNQFYSLQEFGKLITWSIITKIDQSKITYILQPLSYISLSSIYTDLNIICLSMYKDPSHQSQENNRDESFKPRYFITCSKGMLKNITQPGSPNCFNTNSNVIDMVVTIRGGLIYTICDDKNLRIFNKNITQPLLQMQIPTMYPLQSIFIPSILIQQGKQLQLLAQIFISNIKGQIFHYNILENPSEPIEIIKEELSEDKNLLKAAVSLSQDKLEFIFVTRELRTVYSQRSCKANMAKNNQNFKRIVEEDKRVVQMLNSFH